LSSTRSFNTFLAPAAFRPGTIHTVPPTPKPPATSNRNRTLAVAVAVAIVIAAALAAGSYLTRDKGDESTPAETTSTETSGAGSTSPAISVVAGIPQKGTVLGNADANVRLLQFEDLQCPICKTYTDDAFPAIVDEYVRPGLVKIDFRGLAFLGEDSLKALQIAVAAGFQNKLWEVVGLFYENQGKENSGWVTDELIDEILAEVPGLDAAKVKVDAKGPAVAKQIEAVNTQATELKVQGTPWFYIGIGLNPLYEIRPTALVPSAFRPALDDALKG
jgi:protein-disulfide isomerase